MSWDDEYDPFWLSTEEEEPQTLVEQWHQWIEDNRDRDTWALLKEVNDFWNSKLSYRHDIGDRWQTPEESLNRGMGDCEDYALGKMLTLERCGMSADLLRLMYVTYYRPGGVREAHMVLGYHGNEYADDPLILDNVETRIVRRSRRHDLRWVYELNRGGVWMQIGFVGTDTSFTPFSGTLERYQAESGTVA